MAFSLPFKSLQILKITSNALMNIQLWLVYLTPIHFNGPENANAQRKNMHTVIAELKALKW